MVSACDSVTTQAPASVPTSITLMIAEPQPITIRATSSTGLCEMMHQTANESTKATLVSIVVEGVVRTVGDSDREQDTISNDNDNSQIIRASPKVKIDASTRVSWFKRFKRRTRRGFKNLCCVSGSYYTHE